MIGRAQEKVPGGKLLKVEVEFDESKKINRAKITGDFFLHPEDGIDGLENSLSGANATNESELIARLQAVISSQQLMLVGFAPENVAKLVKQATAPAVIP